MRLWMSGEQFLMSLWKPPGVLSVGPAVQVVIFEKCRSIEGVSGSREVSRANRIATEAQAIHMPFHCRRGPEVSFSFSGSENCTHVT